MRGIGEERTGPGNVLVLSIQDSTDDDFEVMLGWVGIPSTCGRFYHNAKFAKAREKSRDLRFWINKDGRRIRVPSYPFGRMVLLNQYELD